MRHTPLAVLVVGALFVSLAWAQKNNGAPKYDRSAEVTIKGVIDEVKDFQCPVSGGMGAHILVKTADKPVLVHLALSKFLKEYDFQFAKGDQVEVIGAKTRMGEEEVILARQVIRGNSTYTFRDKDGNPLW